MDTFPQSGSWLTNLSARQLLPGGSSDPRAGLQKATIGKKCGKAKRKELQVETRHVWYYQTFGVINVEQISSRRDAAGEI
jgi:hypothetical protein